ncbi:ribosomal-protein-L7/L12-serine acetyltransferase [Pseudobythopirellula maris]|uniref:Ribosomal-protein-L7/L12-serine acetyltransferase n=1 Tax=Pseudobythopirellula maris TaxID=2527991 RepID=A0A5C5ZJ00_9BACT|nr:GNAT family N-acetyltransferase [Pseudobythopirellula maris]TWT87344.1 ribosomal-protein-L7/L12-serine acetyltransferase [Pseudobythopirellula maris]
MFAETIETDRLLLRRLRASDAQAGFERYASDPEATRFLRWRTHQSAVETEEFYRQAERDWDAGVTHVWAVCLREEGMPEKLKPWGAISLLPVLAQAELGYVISRRQWGRGVATEAARAVIAEAWRHPTIWRVSATCNVRNAGSARVLEKCGMRLEGTLRSRYMQPQAGPRPQDVLQWAIVRDDLPADASTG